MMFITHLLGGVITFIYLSNFLKIELSLTLISVAAVFALLPDMDTVQSKIGRKLQPFSTILSMVFKHRGFLHSLIFTAIVYFGIRYTFSNEIAMAAGIGYASHLLLDAITKEGIKPLSPLSKMKIKGPIRTNSIFEHAILVILAIFLVIRLV
jgi:inner membrane protein